MMSLFTRIRNAFSPERLHRELEQEMRQHIDEAISRGRTEQEARRAFGNLLLTRERSYDAKVLGWLEAVVADAKFGTRQLRKNWVVSSAAILSLALAIGACTGAFRLIDAVLLRPLPVADASHLYCLTYPFVDQAGISQEADSFSYPLYREMRGAVEADADVLAIGYVSRVGLSFGGDSQMERGYRQFVSGNTFSSLGLHPALGRLLGPADDEKPAAHPVAVLTYDYWVSRFGRDPKVIGRTFRHGGFYQIVGVGPKGFTGTETGLIPGFFLSTMMNSTAIHRADWSWLRIWIHPHSGRNIEPIRDRLQAIFSSHRRQRVRDWDSDSSPQDIEQYVNTRLTLRSAASGVSDVQKQFGRALYILGILIGLVLLIACANVANLFAAQAAARSREMALRVSIGAGRARLVQLVMVESAMLAAAATLLGGVFAWWSAPWVVALVNPPDSPLRLVLPADWRVLGFAATLAVAVTFLFGLVPALRASAVKPAAALRGGDGAHTKLRLIYGLVAAQVAFCFVVHFDASLFVTTFERLSSRPLGFSPDRVLLLETATMGNHKQPAETWRQIADNLRGTPGVESAAVCGWPLMKGLEWTSIVWVSGKAPGGTPYFLSVSPGFLSTMDIRLLAGRDFTRADTPGSDAGQGAPGVAIVSESFARQYFGGQNPVGRFFERGSGEKDKRIRYEIVGLMGDPRYGSPRGPMHPVVFVPFGEIDWATFAVRTNTSDPLSLAPVLGPQVSRMRKDFRVVSSVSERELVNQWSIRARLLATLSLFFAGLALLLSAIGLYGVLNYSVVRRTREIGIRMALGASARSVVGTVTGQIFAVFAVGAVSGLAAGLATQRFLESLLYQVKATDPSMLATPFVLLLGAALLAAVPPVIMAVRIDPARALRSE